MHEQGGSIGKQRDHRAGGRVLRYLDFGKDGGGVDKVCIPPYDPQEAARNRAQLNRVLARYGYRLKESGEKKKNTPSAS